MKKIRFSFVRNLKLRFVK